MSKYTFEFKFVFLFAFFFILILVATDSAADTSERLGVEPVENSVISTIEGDVPPASGDWIITTATNVTNENIIVNGSIVITSTGNLTLRGSQLNFATGGAYVARIEVQSGGALWILDGSTLTSDQTSSTYGLGLQSGAQLHIDDATIDRCGYPNNENNPAFIVNITNVYLNNITFSNTYVGMRLFLVDGITVSNIHFYNASIGIMMNWSHDSTLEGLSFDDVTVGIMALVSNRTVIRKSIFSGISLYGIWNSDSHHGLIYGNQFLNVPSAAIYHQFDASNNTAYLNLFSEGTYLIDPGFDNPMNNGTYGNLYTNYVGYDYNGDLIGDSPFSGNGVTDSLPVCVFGSWPVEDSGWDITTYTVCQLTNYTINGDVTIYDEAKVEIYDTDLWFNCSSDRQYGVFIQNGGELVFAAGSLKSYNVNYRFDIHADDSSSIEVTETVLDGCYHIQTETNETHLVDLQISNSQNAIHLRGTSSASYLYGLKLTNITISDAAVGIYMDYCYNVNISSCNITQSNYGVRLHNSYMIDYLSMSFSSLYVDAFYCTSSTNITFSGIIVDTADDAIDLASCVNTTISDVFATNLDDAIYLHDCENTTIREIQVKGIDTGVYVSNFHYEILDVADCNFEDVSFGILLQNSFRGDNIAYLHNITVTNAPNYAIFATYTKEVHVSNCVLNVHGAYAISMYVGIDVFSIDNCEMFNSSTGVFIMTSVLDTGAGTITNCEFLNMTYGIDQGIYPSTVGNVNVTDNHFYGCAQSIVTRGYMMHIVHNTFEHCDTGVNTRETHLAVIANNTLTNMNNGVITGPYPVNITLYGNIYNHLASDAISFGEYVQSGSIYNETINDCRHAINIDYADNVTVDLVNITNAVRGFFIRYAVNSTITNVDIQSCEYGFYIFFSQEVTLRDCTLVSCDIGIYFEADSYDTANHDIDTSNTFNGKPIYYIHDETGTFYNNLDTFHLTIAYSSFVTINGSYLGGDEVRLIGAQNCTITNSTIATSLQFVYSEDILILANDISDSEGIQIHHTGSLNITFAINSFWSVYNFWSGGFNLNTSNYGNYYYDYPYDVDQNHDGIGDIPFNFTVMLDYLPLLVAPHSFEVVIDIITPLNYYHYGGMNHAIVNVTVLPGIRYTGSTSVIINVGIDGVSFYWGSGGLNEFDWNTSMVADGVHNFSCVVQGGFNPTRWWNASIQITVDNTAPTMVITPDDQFGTSTNLNVTVDIDDALTSIKWGAIYLNGFLIINNTGPEMGMYIERLLIFAYQGVQNVTFVAMDNVGNLISESRTFYYDYEDPIIETDTPYIQYVVDTTGNVIIWNITDTTAYYYNITVDGTYVVGALLTESTVQYNIDGLSVGSHEVRIEVFDRAGNTNSKLVPVLVTSDDTTATATTTTDTTGVLPPDDGLMVIVIALVGVGAVFAVIFIVYFMKRKAG